MTAKAIMIQGTGSDVGKSLMVAALCRLAKRQGLSVAPFKPQNMSNNAAACPDGGEIGRAQALQAQAAGLAPHVDMNPVLLKPQSDQTSQIVIQGKAYGTLEARAFLDKGRTSLLDNVMESFERLSARHDLIIVEGAGSPAETNLRNGDIANMGFARRANVPVILVGDIEKGGVIASLVGTKTVMEPEDASLVHGFIINKFRGDVRLFDQGLTDIADRTGWTSLGVVPWLKAARTLPAEDAISMETLNDHRHKNDLKIVAPMLPRIANFDDADPLRLAPNIQFNWIAPGTPLPQDADIVVLFGTKSTIADLNFLRSQGWHHDIIAHARAGKRILGICGGFQMLGKNIHDPAGYDGIKGSVEGLGLLDVETIMGPEKKVIAVTGSCASSGRPVQAYEIHNGITSGSDTNRPMFVLGDKADGAINANGNIMGSYLHGIFSNDAYRDYWLRDLANGPAITLNYKELVEQSLDELANGVGGALDLDTFFRLAV